jgi:hypothetical protein
MSPGPGAGRRRRLFAAYAVLLLLVLPEILLRAMTREHRGQLRVGQVWLLPYPLVTARRREILGLDPADAAALPYEIPDEHLGWSLRAGARTPPRSGIVYATNALGLRSAPREVPETEAGSARRVLVCGDSFVHGDELDWPETWIEVAEEELGPGHEVWNAGVPGYGTDQAVLRFERLAPRIKPDLAVLGIYRQNLLRSLTFFRSLQNPETALPWSKPRFVLEGAELRLMNFPVVPPSRVEAVLETYAQSSLAEFDRFYWPEFYESHWSDSLRLLRFLRSRAAVERFRERSLEFLARNGEALRMGSALARRFAESARGLGAEPWVLILPDHADLERHQRGEGPLLLPLLEDLRAAGIPALDLAPDLVQALGAGESPGDLYFRGDGHPNARAARAIGVRFARLLREGR